MVNYPINIKKSEKKDCNMDCDLYLSYDKTNYNIFKQNTVVALKPDSNENFVTHLGTQYILEKIVLTQGYHKFFGASENISGDLEIHLEHKQGSKELIIVIFVTKHDKDADSKVFFRSLVDTVGTVGNWDANGPGALGTFKESGFKLFPGIKSFYKFERDSKTWIVMDEKVTGGNTFFNIIDSHITAPLTTGTPTMIPDTVTNLIFSPNINELCNKNYGATMKCYTNDDFKKACGVVKQDSDMIMYKNRYMLIVVLFIITFIVLILIVLYFFEVATHGLEDTSKSSLGNILNVFGLGSDHKGTASKGSVATSESAATVVNRSLSSLAKAQVKKLKDNIVYGNFDTPLIGRLMGEKWTSLKSNPTFGWLFGQKGSLLSGRNVLAATK